MPIRLLIDADACPVRSEAERVAEKFRLRVILFANPSQQFATSADVMLTADRRDSSDFQLFELCRRGDVVVTDDIGLAALALSKGTRALSSRGRIYDAEDIPRLLATRHIAAKARRAGGRTRGPRAFSKADRERFVRTLNELLSSRAGASRGPSAEKQA